MDLVCAENALTSREKALIAVAVVLGGIAGCSSSDGGGSYTLTAQEKWWANYYPRNVWKHFWNLGLLELSQDQHKQAKVMT